MHLQNKDKKFSFNSHLLETGDQPDNLDSFSSCLNALGIYQSRRFVLKLNPVVHGLVNSAVEKAERGEAEFTPEELQAYSTYVHETIHWWQHKGSTSGLLRSLLYPAQTHANIDDLKRLVKLVGPQKSVQAVGIQSELGILTSYPDAGPIANTVTNNFMDTEFYLALTYKPTLDEQIYHDPYFQAAGHSFIVSYGLVLGALITFFDDENLVLPELAPLGENLERLIEEKATGYFYGSEIIRAPVGLLELYEGQARFIQLQFLNFSMGGMTIADARSKGMLNGVYGKAFEIFLKLSESNEPYEIDDPLVALFLLICDLSINPTAGFPSPIKDYENFFLDADPGIRFAILSKCVANELQDLRTRIKNYSAKEYFEVVGKLADCCGFENYAAALATISQWPIKQPRITKLMEEHATFAFSTNVVFGSLFSEFIEFTSDKLARPDFFCWAGYWLTNKSGSAERDLWLKHLSLFSDKEDDGRIFARQIPGRAKEHILDTFNQFYAAIVLYDLTKQWVINDGPFSIDYSWLILESQRIDFEVRVNEIFHKHYDVNLQDFSFIDLKALLAAVQARKGAYSNAP